MSISDYGLKWYQLGGTVENVGTTAVLNLSEQGIGK